LKTKASWRSNLIYRQKCSWALHSKFSWARFRKDLMFKFLLLTKNLRGKICSISTSFSIRILYCYLAEKECLSNVSQKEYRYSKLYWISCAFFHPSIVSLCFKGFKFISYQGWICQINPTCHTYESHMLKRKHWYDNRRII